MEILIIIIIVLILALIEQIVSRHQAHKKVVSLIKTRNVLLASVDGLKHAISTKAILEEENTKWKVSTVHVLSSPIDVYRFMRAVDTCRLHEACIQIHLMDKETETIDAVIDMLHVIRPCFLGPNYTK